MAEQVGNIRVNLYAQIGDEGEQIGLGQAFVPITQRQMQTNHLDVDLNEVFEHLRASLKRVYGPPDEA